MKTKHEYQFFSAEPISIDEFMADVEELFSNVPPDDRDEAMLEVRASPDEDGMMVEFYLTWPDYEEKPEEDYEAKQIRWERSWAARARRGMEFLAREAAKHDAEVKRLERKALRRESMVSSAEVLPLKNKA